jgi:predicted metal-dependent HD superfamily phosphohydrolase
MEQPFLSRHWTQAWQALGIAPPPGLFERLIAAYSEPQRHYHDVRHLSECCAHFDAQRAAAVRPAEIVLALFFHDAVYDPRAADNEARSADWARDALHQAGAADETARRVAELIMATRHDGRPADADARLLVDIDLAILGAPPERFAEYEAQIRREYEWVPELLFRRKRREILEQFLARRPIYATAGLRALCEEQARVNLLS